MAGEEGGEREIGGVLAHAPWERAGGGGDACVVGICSHGEEGAEFGKPTWGKVHVG